MPFCFSPLWEFNQKIKHKAKLDKELPTTVKRRSDSIKGRVTGKMITIKYDSKLSKSGII